MPRRVAHLVLLLTIVFAPACARLPAPAHYAQPPLPHAVNINSATPDELQNIPHVGESLARRIVQHREAHGPFRRVEHLMLIQGISDKRFRRIRPLVRVE